MIQRRLLLIGFIGASLSSCSSWFRPKELPEVTQIVVFKESRKLYLYSGDKAVRSYDIDLGFSPIGDKKIEGDGKTPEGRYYIDRKNPNSAYHLSLGISYPSKSDKSEAKKLGKSPGKDIFIHGRVGFFGRRPKKDWTWGCVSVSNSDIEEIYELVDIGTVIDINP
jgi:murein L,D-transpeptidase YafK